MYRRVISVLSMLLLALVCSAKVYIPLVKSVPVSTGNNGNARSDVRTGTYAPMAYYEENVLHIQYPVSTFSSVIISNDSTDLAVLRNTFDIESTDVTVDISSLTLNRPYNLSVNAFGVWWVGYFDYMEVSPLQMIQKGFSAVVNDPRDRNYGVYSVAGNATSGWNYGVSGMLYGQNGGTGIYGSSRYDEGFNTGGRYAGLFHGDVKTTDAVFASAYNTLADSRLNKNSEELETGSLDNLMQMSVYRYGLKQYFVDDGETVSSLGYFNDDSGILGKDHYGLSGQEIMELYPELVSRNPDGYLSVNYMEMVPLLIQSIKELKTQLDKTTSELEIIKSGVRPGVSMPGQSVILYQNTPNPFTERSVVNCVIPHDVIDAEFCIYDYNGRQIRKDTINARGNVRIVVERNGLEPGIYLYSIVTDGALVDTKRMVVAE